MPEMQVPRNNKDKDGQPQQRKNGLIAVRFESPKAVVVREWENSAYVEAEGVSIVISGMVDIPKAMGLNSIKILFKLCDAGGGRVC